MYKVILLTVLAIFSHFVSAAQWIRLTSADIQNVQLIQQNNSHGSPEGLYIGLKNNIVGEAATYCARKDFVVITDPKLIDRVYSGLMFAATTQKTFQFYINGVGSCLFLMKRCVNAGLKIPITNTSAAKHFFNTSFRFNVRP